MARTRLTIKLHSHKGVDEMPGYDPKRKRRAISKDEKIGALLIQCGLVDREWAKSRDCKRILQEVEWDHDPVPVAWGGTNHPTNLTARLVGDHREKTRKKDIKAIAKVRRHNKKLMEKANEYVQARNAILRKNAAQIAADVMVTAVEGPQRKSKWPAQKRKWPTRKINSRSTFRTGRSSGKGNE